VAPFGWYRLAIAAVFTALLGFQLLTLPVP